MRKRREDDPFMASECDHAQSELTRRKRVQGAEAKSVLYENGTDALKNRLFSMKLHTYLAYCILFDISKAKS
jgi:hypothetical protein